MYGQALSDAQILAHYEAGALGVFPAPGYVSPAGDFSTLQEHPDGTFTRTWPDGTRHEFDSTGRQTAVADRSGNTTTYTYVGNDRLIAITDPVGQVTPRAMLRG